MSITYSGLASVFVGAAINNFGIVLQKRQVNVTRAPGGAESHVGDIGIFLKDPVWLLGILMQTLLCLPFILYAFDTLGITLAQPLANAGIIFQVFGLVVLLRERLNRVESIGVVLLVAGMIGIGAGGVTGDITSDTFMNPLALHRFRVMCGILLSLVIFCLVFLRIVRIRMILLGFLHGILMAGVSISLQIVTISLDVLPGSNAWVMLTAGGFGAAAGTILGILAIQEAFKLGQAINVVPFVQIALNSAPVLAGLTVFNQHLTHPVIFSLGTILIITAASMLARFQE